MTESSLLPHLPHATDTAMTGLIPTPMNGLTTSDSPAATSITTAAADPPAMTILPEVSTTLAVVTNPTLTASTTSKDELCPSCAKDGRPVKRNLKTTHWVECEACRTWYHWDCVSGGQPLSTIDKWYCTSCLQLNASLVITFKPPARKSARKRTQLNYATLDGEGASSSNPDKWTKMIENKPLAPDRFKRMKGEEVSVKWMNEDETAFREPIVIEDARGLGMRMPCWPSEDGVGGATVPFDVRDVAQVVGEETPVEVIDVATQSNSPGWNLARWAEYYHKPEAERDKIRNVISLEVTGTPMAEMITPPRLVQDIDWFQRYWPLNRRSKGQFPKVQLYCLMSVAKSWTDMHVDFAGSSVFYHVLKGSKVFYFIRPTKANLNAYEKWCGSELQSSTWLGDLVDEVVKVELQQGNTMFIPTGWIHAVYTPIDSLVIGGNFLHSYNISTQLKVRDIEIKTRVPKKFRFPMFQRMCWYVGEAYTRALRNKEDICPRILPELRTLSDFLVSEARLIENTANDSTKKETKDMVPADKVPDPPALARELRWRLRLLLDGESGDEKPTKQVNGHGIVNGGARSKRSTPSNGVKRKRLANDERAGSQDTMLSDSAGGIFKNYTPRPWESVKKTDGLVLKRSAVPLPEDWEAGANVGSSRVGDLETRTDSVVKVRRVEGEKGKVILERETIVRTKEVWCAEDGDVMQVG